MTDAIFLRSALFLHACSTLRRPETANLLYAVDGIHRMLLNGPSVPAIVPYGPAKGQENPHTMRQRIMVGDKALQLQVQVGTTLLELENRDIIPAI